MQLGFTDYSQPLTIGSLTFEAAAGFTSSAIATDNTASVNNSQVESYLDSDAIASDDIRAGRYYDAKIEVLLVNYLDLPTSLPSPKAPSIQTGYVGEIEASGEDSFRFELRGLTQLLQQKVGITTQQLCQASLGDQNCRKSLTNFRFNATVTAVDAANRSIAASALTQPADYFGNGSVLFASGANNGLSKEILAHSAGGVLGLSQPMPFPIAVGDAIVVTAGCRKTIEACSGKFDNIKNHYGMPMLPGSDFYASGKGGTST